MAWQLFFILWMVIGFWDYYIEEAYSYFDLAEQVPGYLLLIAMSVTSFRFGRSRLNARQWKILHQGGIYFIWAVVWSTCWFELFSYDNVQVIDLHTTGPGLQPGGYVCWLGPRSESCNRNLANRALL